MPSEPVLEFRRHPTSVLFGIASVARRFVVPWLLALLFAGPGSRLQMWIGVLVIPAAVAAVLEYLLVRYEMRPDELVVRRGLLFRNVRHVPYGRIQNVDLVQNPFHRALGVAEVRIQTASGDEPEAHIRVLSLATVEEMRRRIFAGRAAAREASAVEEAPAEAAATLLHLGPRELTLLGVIWNRGLVIVAAVLGLLWQAADLLGERYPWMQPGQAFGRFLREELRNVAARGSAAEWLPRVGSWLVSAALLVLALAVVVVLLRVLSVAWALVTLWDFRLERRGEDLRTTCGLFTRTVTTVPRRRIQRLAITQTFLHRRFARATVQAETAGGTGAEAGERTAEARAWLVPLVHVDRLPALLAEIQPELELDAVAWMPVSARAGRRIRRKWLVVSAVLTGWACLHARAWGLLALVPLLPLALALPSRQARALGYALTDRAVLSRRGLWTRVVRAARHARVQVVALRQSPFDRRHRMATVHVDTAGRSSGAVRIPYLDDEVAADVHRRLVQETARTEFRW